MPVDVSQLENFEEWLEGMSRQDMSKALKSGGKIVLDAVKDDAQSAYRDRTKTLTHSIKMVVTSKTRSGSAPRLRMPGL